MKKLAFLFWIFWSCQTPVFAKDIFSDPFGYLSDTATLPLQSSVGKWYVKSVALQSLIGVTRDAATGLMRADLFSGTGAGVSWEREIVVNHKYYQSFAVTAGALFSPVSASQPFVNFSGCLILSTLDGWVGGGVKLDGKSVSGIIMTKGDLPF
jgi:hypothetical protein